MQYARCCWIWSKSHICQVNILARCTIQWIIYINDRRTGGRTLLSVPKDHDRHPSDADFVQYACMCVCVCGNKKSRAHPSIHPAEFQSKIKRMWVPVLCRYCYRNNIMIMICGYECVCVSVWCGWSHIQHILYICKSDIGMLGWEGNHYILRIVSEGRVHQVCALHVCVVVTR